MTSPRRIKRRFNELAAAVAEARELARSGVSASEASQRQLADLATDQRAIVAELRQLSEQIRSFDEAQRSREQKTERFRADMIEGLRRVHADEAWHRRRLREVRESPRYEAAFEEPEPLVSVVIPTYERLEMLRTRTIPSILAQEYRNFEIVIVGDNSPYGAEDISAGFERAPIRFANLTLRGPYPGDRIRSWMASGTPPLNEAMHLARGAWLAPLADDDAMRPQHLRVLLNHARAARLEFVYGRYHYHAPHADSVVGRFPPQYGSIGLQVALLHHLLKFFELELTDSTFDVPNDWGHVDRMMRAGVRMGMVSDVVTDHYPSLRGLTDSETN